MELYLIVKTNESGADQTLAVDGEQWRLSGPYDADGMNAIPPYACVSYVWGAGRLENSLFPSHLMSDHTLPALQAVVRAAPAGIAAFWIDAFCIPYHQPARSATLESMGYIYSAADCVVAALGSELCEALREMTKRDWLTEDLLSLFESNAWIASVWTYQEIVNAQKVLVTSMTLEAPVIEGDTFLNRIGYSLHMYKQQRPFSSFDMRRVWPQVDAFEDVGGDYMLYSAFNRPALQIMSMLDRRIAQYERNKCYTMIGALTAKRTGRDDAAGEGLASLRKKVIDVSEEKGDWSFLYSSTVRDETEPWMPSSEQELRSVLPYFTHGSGQSGRRDEESRVWLEKVHVMRSVLGKKGEVDVATLKDIISRLSLNVATDSSVSLGDLKEQVRNVLMSAGFTGRGEEIIMPYGMFYPQESAPSTVDVDVITSTEIFWTFGRPGMLVARGDRGNRYIPGVLIGAPSAGLDVEEYMLGSKSTQTTNVQDRSRIESD